MEFKPLEEIAFINPDSIKKGYPYDEIEYVDISSVGTGYLIETKSMLLSEASSRAKRLVKDGDTILSTVRPNRRSFLYVKTPKSNIVVSTGFTVLRAKDGVDSRYLYYSVTDQKFTDYLTLSAKGAAYPAVDTEIIQRGKVPFLPLNIQKKISSILSAYDDLIENNLRRIQTLEEMAQLIYKEWFVNFRFPGHDKVRMIDSELGLIPEGWQVLPVREVVSFHIGGGWGKPSAEGASNEPAFVIRGTDIPRLHTGDISTCPYRFHAASNLNKRRLLPMDFVFEVSGGSKNQPLGRTILVGHELLSRFSKNVICASFCKLVRPNQALVSPYYMDQYFKTCYNSGEITQYQVQSTGISNFKFETFLDQARIVIPTVEVGKNYYQSVRPIYDFIEVLGHQNANLRATRELLLPKLISGEIDVSKLDIPASVGES